MQEVDLIICRCEEVALEEIVHTATTYQCSQREVKMRTRAGMGYCGGRMCRPLIESIQEKLESTMKERKAEPKNNEIPLGYRPPIRPVSFAQLGGEQK